VANEFQISMTGVVLSDSQLSRSRLAKDRALQTDRR